MAVLNFPKNPASQTPVNTYSPTSSPDKTTNGVTYTFVDSRWKATAPGSGEGGGGDADDITYEYPGSGVEQTVQGRLEQYVSVKDFGAVGDGTTDDTAAIQAAIDSSALVTIPHGKYRVTSTIYLRDYSNIQGESFYDGNRFVSFGKDYNQSKNTIIFYDGPNTNTAVVHASQFEVGVEMPATGLNTELQDPVLSNFIIDCNNKADIGFYCYRSTHIQANNIAITKSRAHGFLVIGTFSGRFNNSVAYNNEENGFTIGVDVFGWARLEYLVNNVRFENIAANNNGTAKTFNATTNPTGGVGFRISINRAVVVTSISCETNDGFGMYVEGGNYAGGNIIDTGYFEANCIAASDEGRSPHQYQMAVDATRLLNDTNFKNLFINYGSVGGPIRIYSSDNTTPDRLENCVTFENISGSRYDGQVYIQSTTNAYRVVNSVVDTTLGASPLFRNYGNHIFTAAFTIIDGKIDNPLIDGYIESVTRVGEAEAAVAFKSSLPFGDYLGNVAIFASCHQVNRLAYVTNVTKDGFTVVTRNTAGDLSEGHRVNVHGHILDEIGTPSFRVFNEKLVD